MSKRLIIVFVAFILLLASCAQAEKDERTATSTQLIVEQVTQPGETARPARCIAESRVPTPDPTVQALLPPIDVGDWVKGPEDAHVSIVEYSDFQCPACRSFVPIVEEVLNNNPETVTLTYRHFPLIQHKNAERAAQFAEAAGIQGKFFEMHDMLFEKQEDWAELGNPDEVFVSYGEELELDIEQLKADADSDEVAVNIRDAQPAGAHAFVANVAVFGEQMIEQPHFKQIGGGKIGVPAFGGLY